MSIQMQIQDHSLSDISPTFSIGDSALMTNQDHDKPRQNVADMLHNMWKRAGYDTQDAFAVACGYVGQHSMGDYFNRRKTEGKYFSVRLVNKFLKGLVTNAPRPLPESEVWELVAPEHRPRVPESADSPLTFRKAFDVARRQFSILAHAGLIQLNEAQVTVLATAFARELVDETEGEPQGSLLEQAVDTAARLGGPEQ